MNNTRITLFDLSTYNSSYKLPENSTFPLKQSYHGVIGDILFESTVSIDFETDPIGRMYAAVDVIVTAPKSEEPIHLSNFKHPIDASIYDRAGIGAAMQRLDEDIERHKTMCMNGIKAIILEGNDIGETLATPISLYTRYVYDVVSQSIEIKYTHLIKQNRFDKLDAFLETVRLNAIAPELPGMLAITLNKTNHSLEMSIPHGSIRTPYVVVYGVNKPDIDFHDNLKQLLKLAYSAFHSKPNNYHIADQFLDWQWRFQKEMEERYGRL